MEQQQESKSSEKGSRLGPLAILLKFGGKFIAVLSKVLKGLTLGKGLLFAASFGGWLIFFNWKFVLFLMGSIFIHELGHVWAMKRCGMPVKGIYFIPMMGAAAVTEKNFPSRGAESFIALMGPVWGLVTALVVYGVYLITNVPLYAALAGWISTINLFNLLPVNPLDGGRVLKSLIFSINTKLGIGFLILALLAMGVLAWKTGFVLLYCIIFVSFLELMQELKSVYRQWDRERIIAAVADELGIAQDPIVVANWVNTFESACMHDRACCNAEMADAREKVLYDLEKTALNARGKYRLPFTKRYMTDFDECSVRGFIIEDERNGLKNYLRVVEMPRMKLVGIGLTVLSYVSLISFLLGLLYLTKHVPGADIAFKLFRS